MKPEQVDRRLDWLDEQRRKDAERLQRLETRLAGLEEGAAKTANQVKELAAENARLSALAARIAQFDETLSKHRQEVARLLSEAEDSRSAKEKLLEQARKRDQADLARNLAEMQADLQRMGELRHFLDARREEEARLTRTLDGVAKALEDLRARQDDQTRWLTSFEEARKQEGKRVAELQGELTDLRIRLEAARGALDSVEDRVRRLEVRAAEFSASDAERREALTLWMEQQNLRQVEFERGAKEWERRFETFEKMALELEQRMIAYDETYRSLRQQKEELNALLERLERRIGEVGEMQRLAEERARQEWAGFLADEQRRWNSEKLTRDEQWREHSRLHERLAAEVDSLNAGMETALRTLADLTGSTQQRLSVLLALLREWTAETQSQSESLG